VDEQHIRVEVSRIGSSWVDANGHLELAVHEADRLQHEVDDAVAELDSLFSAKRAARREEKGEYQAAINEAISRKRDLISGIRSKKAEISALRNQVRRLRGEAVSLGRLLKSEVGKLARGADRIRNISTLAAAQGVDRMWDTVSSGHGFCAAMLRELDPILCNSSSDVDGIGILPGFVADGAAALVEGVVDTIQLVGSAIREVYSTQDDQHSLPFEAYTLTDGLGLPGTAVQEVGDAAVQYSKALLEKLGHCSIFEIGGAGLPDILSIDTARRLCVSEIKGTRSYRTLSASGLVRQVISSDVGGNKTRSVLLENSPAWLLRSSGNFDRVGQVLAAIDLAMKQETNPSKCEELRILRESYREAARSGFNPLVCDRQLVQVGFHTEGEALKPPYAVQSTSLDNYVRDAMPSKIIQIDVLPNSSGVPGFSDAESNAALPDIEA
jgi:hypothetical protein